ncbi:hypothetical protein HN51_046938 [Arachis hypogaea]|nr:uncharacterized protein DS421_12g361390 [Arachis hypogaea]
MEKHGGHYYKMSSCKCFQKDLQTHQPGMILMVYTAIHHHCSEDKTKESKEKTCQAGFLFSGLEHYKSQELSSLSKLFCFNFFSFWRSPLLVSCDVGSPIWTMLLI